MNEYNERILKNVLQDIREENDDELLKEIEDAKNDPLFQIKDGEAEAFVKKHYKTQKKKLNKIFIKVASILLAAAIGITFIPFTVEGRRSSLAEIISNCVNSEFIIFGNNENDNLLLSYEGEFVPTYIPEGYSVKSVTNTEDKKEIVFSDVDNHLIIFVEQNYDVKSNIDYKNTDHAEKIKVLEYDGVYYENDGIKYISFVAEKKCILISCDDSSVDLIGFSKKIEKR